MAVSRESINSLARVIESCISEQAKQMAHLLFFSGFHMHVKFQHFGWRLAVVVVGDIVCVKMVLS